MAKCRSQPPSRFEIILGTFTGAIARSPVHPLVFSRPCNRGRERELGKERKNKIAVPENGVQREISKKRRLPKGCNFLESFDNGAETGNIVLEREGHLKNSFQMRCSQGVAVRRFANFTTTTTILFTHIPPALWRTSFCGSRFCVEGVRAFKEVVGAWLFIFLLNFLSFLYFLL